MAPFIGYALLVGLFAIESCWLAKQAITGRIG